MDGETRKDSPNPTPGLVDIAEYEYFCRTCIGNVSNNSSRHREELHRSRVQNLRLT